MDLAPLALAPITMFKRLAFLVAEELDTGAIHQQVWRLGGSAARRLGGSAAGR